MSAWMRDGPKASSGPCRLTLTFRWHSTPTARPVWSGGFALWKRSAGPLRHSLAIALKRVRSVSIRYSRARAWCQVFRKSVSTSQTTLPATTGEADHEIDDLVEAAKRLSPDVALSRWRTTKKVMADPAALDLLLQQWQKPCTVGRNGVALSIMGQTIHYGQWEAALRPFKALKKADRKPINIAFDPHDIRAIRVYDGDFRFLCTVGMNDRGGLHAGDAISQDKVAELCRQKALYNRASKHVAEHSLTSVLTNEEHLAAMAAQEHDRQKRPPAEDTGRRCGLCRRPLMGRRRKSNASGIARQWAPKVSPMASTWA